MKIKMNFNDSAGHNGTTGDHNTNNISNANVNYYPQQREAEANPTHYHQNPHLYGPPASRGEHFLESLTGGKIQWEASVFALSTLALALGVLGILATALYGIWKYKEARDKRRAESDSLRPNFGMSKRAFVGVPYNNFHYPSLTLYDSVSIMPKSC